VAKFRFGHIDLAAPVVHTWFCKSAISVLTILTGLTAEEVLKIMNFSAHVIVSPVSDTTQASQNDGFIVGEVISDAVHASLWERKNHFSLASGGSAILFLLERAKLDEIKTKLTAEINTTSSASQLKELKEDCGIIDNMITNNVNPQWIVLKLLPVMPAVLRPILPLRGNDNFSTSDLNILYGKVITANNAVLKIEGSFTEDKAPSRMVYLSLLRELQQAIDELIDTSVTTETLRYNSTPLKSLTDILKGKEGRFRQSLLGRWVDYSGRTIIAPGPHLRLWECGIPKEIALELFKPFIYAKILTLMDTNDIEIVKQTWADDPKLIDSILEVIVKDRPVILNRAPTLHKLSMLAFNCIIINEKVIRLHPLVCAGFNADFDGDQMAIHVPLSEEARLEARDLLLATRNILHPADGTPAIFPNQDMVLGLYYASLVADGEINIIFGTYPDVRESLASREVRLHTKVQFLHRDNGKIKVMTTT
ncbi:MAG: DNA-directed RNA polymerase subunit beta', partial [Candidatus Hodgkinia cicadicola]